MIIIALDPGKMTGVAVMQSWSTVTSEEVDFEHIMPRMEQLIQWACAQGPTAVVMENFIINAQTLKNTQSTWSLRLIGVGEYLAQKYGATFTLQSPADAKKLVSNDVIRRLGWWVPGTKGHDKDALRHLATFALKNGWRHEAFIPG